MKMDEPEELAEGLDHPDREIARKGEYAQEYSDENFWEKLKKYGTVAGKEVVEKALILFYALKDKSVPMWARATIIGALGYFISPIDAISDLIPVAGYADDLGVLAAAIATIAVYINDDIKEKARKKLSEWFD